MKKYNKPVSKKVVLDEQALLAGSLGKDNQGIDGSDVGAKRFNGILIDDEEEE